MELLDADFSPVWLRDVLVANETIALAEEAAACRAARKAQRRSEKYAGRSLASVCKLCVICILFCVFLCECVYVCACVCTCECVYVYVCGGGTRVFDL